MASSSVALDSDPRDSAPSNPHPANSTTSSQTQRPQSQPQQQQEQQQQPPQSSQKKKKHRAGRRHKHSRRKSIVEGIQVGEGLADAQNPGDSFYLNVNVSNTSLESEALLDHREQGYQRPRRASTMLTTPFQTPARARTTGNILGDDGFMSERAPLLSSSARVDTNSTTGYGSNDGKSLRNRNRRGSSRSSGRQATAPRTPSESYNVNYPPSVPGSPTLGPTDPMGGFRDVMMHDDQDRLSRRSSVMGIETEDNFMLNKSSLERRHTVGLITKDDVCMPQETMSELGEFDLHLAHENTSGTTRRRRRQKWPDLNLMDEFARQERESRSETARRVKKIAEPQLIEGRLRPANGKRWFSVEEDAPYRFTYFNIDFEDTIHTQTFSELQQPDLGFRELFLPDPPLLSDSSEDESDTDEGLPGPAWHKHSDSTSRGATRPGSIAQQLADRRSEATTSPRQLPVGSTNTSSNETSGVATPIRFKSPQMEAKAPIQIAPMPKIEKPPRYGERPVWWLDVFSPTQRELELLSKAFGIHPLTTEDIWLQEEREKVELFRNYYFITYQSFDQDSKSENFMEPLIMYIVVFREGVISFHWNPTPHPANVRRRIRFLKDYVRIDADWIGYGIIDDVTDVYIPLIQNIEDEVDDIDDAILRLHSSSESVTDQKKDAQDNEKSSGEGENKGHLLHRVGACRKKVMRLYRLLGTKADVIKGFAKRCNEQWQVAPRSDIGMYLGDIQDHIVTMTGNLSHYDVILARCHANYIAQINIRMGERQEATADGLNKLTVLGTIVLPMNIITGLWGMNVWVPGQEDEGYLGWFFLITAGLAVFGVLCYYAARRVRLV